MITVSSILTAHGNSLVYYFFLRGFILAFRLWTAACKRRFVGLSCSSAPCLRCAMGTSWTSTASNTLVVNSGDALSFQ